MKTGSNQGQTVLFVPDSLDNGASTLLGAQVLALDGHSYERAAIENWLKYNLTSPKTNAVLDSKMLIPNYTLRVNP